MTRSIRADLEGVVHAYHEDGSDGPVLSAGDVVPDGVVVGDHLLGEESDAIADDAPGGGPNPVPAPGLDDDPDGDELDDELDDEDSGDEADGLDKPAGNAGRQAWADYADAIGVEYDEGAGRDDIRAAVAAHDATAHEG